MRAKNKTHPQEERDQEEEVIQGNENGEVGMEANNEVK